jgi:hypothetical protein
VVRAATVPSDAAIILEVMQKESSTIVVTANVPRELREEVGRIARRNFHSTAAEVRIALAERVERERVRVQREVGPEGAALAGTPGGAVEAGLSAP